ncbi:MAG: Bax inhibitor-1 family protein, partial [Myxococcota bacterium]
MHANDPFNSSNAWTVAQAPVEERAEFIQKTYQHLAMAIAGFVVLEAVLLNLPGIDQLVATMLGGRWTWLIVLGLFMGVSHIATNWAQSSTSLSKQYMGLGLYVVAEAIIFVPILFIASRYAPDVIPKAGGITLLTFGGLTAMVFMTKTNFSFLGGMLSVAGWAAMGAIGVSLIFGFNLGTWFSVAMVVFA